MTREQAKQNLIGFGIAEPTDEQITNYLNQVNGESQRFKEKADKYDVAQAELEAEKAKNMTAEEKLAAAEKAANDRATEFARKSNRLEVEKILVGAGLVEDDYKDLIETFVSDDGEKSKASATAFATLVSKQRESATQKTKEELMNKTQKPGGNGGNKQESKTEAEKFAESLASSSAGNKESQAIIDSYKL